jgi:ParB family chromosome partitioning protein
MPKRPEVTSFLSNSSRAAETNQKLEAAHARIAELEKELSERHQNLLMQVGAERIRQMVVSVGKIERRPYRSRRERNPEKFQSLVDSIKSHGFLGSIWVQILADGKLRLIAGETRLDAAIEAGQTEISVDALEVDDVTAVKLSRIENSRRQNLNAIDDAEEILYFISRSLGRTREEVISLLYQLKNADEGKTSINSEMRQKLETAFEEVAPDLKLKSFIATRLRLLNLPADVLAAYNAGQIGSTHAIELAKITDSELRQSVLEKAIEEKLSVSEIRTLSKPTTVPRSVMKLVKVRAQIEGIDDKSIQKMSLEERQQLKQEIEDLENLLRQKRQAIEDL